MEQPIMLKIVIADEDLPILKAIAERVMNDWKEGEETEYAAQVMLAEIATTHTKIMALDLQKLLEFSEESFYEDLYGISINVDFEALAFKDASYVPQCAKSLGKNNSFTVPVSILFAEGKETLQ